MKNIYLYFSLIIFSCMSFAAENYSDLKGCGKYKIAGIIRKDAKDGIKLIVNEHTGSEYQFKPASGQMVNFAGTIDIPISMIANITKIDGTKGFVASPSDIQPIIPSPLNPKESSGFILIKKKNCE